MPPPRSRCPPVCLRYLFRYCVEARTGTSVRRDVWRVALDDRLLGRASDCDQGVVRVRSLIQIIAARRWRPAR
ncbi:YxiG-like protein [Streptosporangium sandarakinum]|uniref:YxiG-like protein n=1 Tax=Streptosporangium sandarakinum TaxID=1260955 RepID=UPI003F4B0A17